MERKEFELAVEDVKCIPGGIKEACMIVNEYLNEGNFTGAIIQKSAVTEDEFTNAVITLMAYAWQNRDKDCIPETYYCESDCSLIDKCAFCPGECQIAPNDKNGKSLSRKLCPFYSDSYYI